MIPSIPLSLILFRDFYNIVRISYFEITARSIEKLKSGVPPPIVFNFYIFLLPPSPPSDMHLFFYADYCTIAASGFDIKDVTILINGYLNQLANR